MSGAVELPPSESAGDQRSFVRLLFTTPMGQLLRGRVTGPLPRHAPMVVASALPASLTSLVNDITKQTRLWRSEQHEIARELAAHFADGLDTGLSEAELISDFGDRAQAVSLLRRAAKRNRPWPWQAAKRSVQATVLMLAFLFGLYALLAARYFFSGAGTIVDYRPQLNAKAVEVPVEDRAWPLYRAALLVSPRTHPETVVSELDLRRMPGPGELGWDRVEAILDSQAEALELARQAAAKPGLGMLIGYDFSTEDLEALRMTDPVSVGDITSPEHDGVMGFLFPHLASIRNFAVSLGHSAQRNAAAGDADATLRDIDAMLGMARHVRETPILIGELVGLAVLARACDTLCRVLATKPNLLSDVQLTHIAHRLAAFDDAGLRPRFDGERLFFSDVLQRIYTDDGSGDGRLTPGGLKRLNLFARLNGSIASDDGIAAGAAVRHLSGPLFSAFMLGRADMQREYDRVMGLIERESREPLWERDTPESEQLIENWMSSAYERLRRYPLTLMLAALSRASISAEMTMMRRDVALTAIALEMRHRRHGEWPASLDAIVPSMLPELPIDRFDGQALRYMLRDGKPLLYSVGTDREDDGGTPSQTGRDSAQRWFPRDWVAKIVPNQKPITTGDGRRILDVDGDWLLWPPQDEGPIKLHDPATEQ